MDDAKVAGYAGKILRVDLSKKKISEEKLDEGTIKKWVGGVGLAAKYLYEEVPPGVEWSDPKNRLIFATGPLAGSGVSGAATFTVVSKGPMTNLAGASQANGYLGAYLKFSGYDGIIFEGTSPDLAYLWIKDGKAEIRDARHLAGKHVWEVRSEERLVRDGNGNRRCRVSGNYCLPSMTVDPPLVGGVGEGKVIVDKTALAKNLRKNLTNAERFLWKLYGLNKLKD